MNNFFAASSWKLHLNLHGLWAIIYCTAGSHYFSPMLKRGVDTPRIIQGGESLFDDALDRLYHRVAVQRKKKTI